MKHLKAEDLAIIATLLGRVQIQAADARKFLDMFERLNLEYQEAMNGDNAKPSEQGPEGAEAVRATD